MSNFNYKLKKGITLFAMIAMVAVMFPMMPAQGATIMDGDLVVAAGSSAVYMISGATKRVFPHVNVYLSWGYPSNFSTVKTVSAADMASYTDGEPVPFRDGSLFRGTASGIHGKDATAVFAVEDGKMRPVLSEAVYQALYNDASWGKVTWVPDDLLSKFTYVLGDTVTSSASHMNGALVKYTGTSQVYVIANGQKRAISDAAMTANRYRAADVIEIASSEVYADGANVTGAESALMTPGSVAVVPVSGTGLSIALASDTPAATTLVSDTTNSNSQAMVPFIKVSFTASSDGDVQVNTLKFTRSGISSDSDLSALSLWDGSTKLGDYNSFVEKVVTFTKSGGLFTVPAGTTKTVTLKGDLTDGTSSGKTIAFNLSSASNVTTNGATVSGSAMGSVMSTAGISDLGTLTIASSTYPASVDPGDTEKEVWAFSVNPDQQNIMIEKIKLTMIGTSSATDLANFKLYEGATLLGSVAAMTADKTITFDGLNYAMDKSATTKTFSLKADIIDGTSRSFYFSIENMDDVTVKDTNYGVYVKPNSADTWTIIYAGASTDVNSGALTVTRNSASPVGNVADNSTDIELAKFDFKAAGEDIKVTSLPVAIEMTTATTINNIKLLLDGSQVGTTDTSVTDYDSTAGNISTFSFGNTFVIPAGTTKVVTIVGDIEGTSMGNGATIVAQLTGGTNNARGIASSTNISSTASAGNTLTVATGTISAAKNIALSEYAATYPAGVAGTTNVRIASFVITAGSAEGSRITQMVVKDAQTATYFLGGYYQNLKLMNGTTQIGSTKGTLTNAATSYTFTPSSAINLAASQSYVLDVYADIKSGVTLTTATALANLYSISYTTAVTAESSTYIYGTTTGVDGQTNYIAAAGDMRVSKDSSSVSAKQMVMGTTDETLATFKLHQYNGAEAMNVSQIVLSDTTTVPGELNNIRIYDGSTLLGTVPTLSGSSSPYTATFSLASNLVIPKGAYKLLTVKANVTPFQGNTTSANTHAINMYNTGAITARGASSNTSITILDSAGGAFASDGSDALGNTHYVYRTKPTFALNASSPSGSAVGSAAQTVMKLDVTADAANDVVLTDIIFTASSGTAGVIADGKSYKLYDWNDTLIQTVSLTSALADFDTLASLTIPAGQTKTLTLKADTSSATTDNTFQVYVGASTDIQWNDGIATETDSALNKAIPLYGGTFKY